MDFRSGADVKLPITLIRNGEPLVPDVGSVTYTVYDHTGVAIVDLEDVSVVTDITTYRLALTIPASANDIDAARRFERRRIVVSFERGGIPDYVEAQYRLVPILHYTVTPQEVRGFLGVNQHELADEDIDLFETYLVVEELVGQSEIETALTAGTTSEFAANELVRMLAAMRVIPSLRQRIAQEEKNGVKSFSRASIRDFRQLAAEAQARFDAALDVVTGASVDDVVLSMILVTQDVDPITGE